MSIKQKTMLGAGRLFVVSTILVGVPTFSHTMSAIEQQYLKCSLVARDSARLSCYDLVSREYEQAQAAVRAPREPQEPQSQAAAPVADETQRQVAEPAPVLEEAGIAAEMPDEERFAPLSDDVGLSSLERKEKDERQTIRATVTSCKLGASGKYYFYFDNGQVWKQAGSGSQKFEVCNFAVTITRDVFGYKMQPDADKRRVRISRVK